MDYVIKADGTIVDHHGKPYTGYVRDVDWHDAIARGRRPIRPPVSMGNWRRFQPLLRSQGQPNRL